MNLIANDLVIVSPMSSMTGYIAYVNYTAGSTRNGRVANESSFMSPFAIGDMTPENTGYTSERVVENFETAPTKVAWTPCVAGEVKAFDADGNAVAGITVAADGTLSGTDLADVRKVAYL